MKFELSEEQLNKLVQAALAARNMAYAPYSNFRVGAALLTYSGDIVSGCNVENASYGATICAERNAIFSAIGRGYSDFEAICIAGDADEVMAPCGICRQVMAEFSDNMIVVCANKDGKTRLHTLSELLPHKFEFRK